MQVIGEPAVVAGNSLGGYASLATAVRYPDAVKGVVLLNAAGRFEEVKAEAQAQVEATLPNTEAGQEAKAALREVRL
jgi:pimeloyl-ACP methyl ester carboxylesterase